MISFVFGDYLCKTADRFTHDRFKVIDFSFSLKGVYVQFWRNFIKNRVTIVKPCHCHIFRNLLLFEIFTKVFVAWIFWMSHRFADWFCKMWLLPINNNLTFTIDTIKIFRILVSVVHGYQIKFNNVHTNFIFVL